LVSFQLQIYVQDVEKALKVERDILDIMIVHGIEEDSCMGPNQYPFLIQLLRGIHGVPGVIEPCGQLYSKQAIFQMWQYWSHEKGVSKLTWIPEHGTWD